MTQLAQPPAHVRTHVRATMSVVLRRLRSLPAFLIVATLSLQTVFVPAATRVVAATAERRPVSAPASASSPVRPGAFGAPGTTVRAQASAVPAVHDVVFDTPSASPLQHLVSAG